METSGMSYGVRKDRSAVALFARNALTLVWNVLRIPVASVLVLLEPVVCFALAALAILSVIAAIFWKVSGIAPAFPLWGLLAFSAGSIVLLAIYYALIRLFTRA
jgi:hypothetical protein